ncbi:MAG: gp58-like family protein [Rickettsia endosymbiont of Pseudomimeciton antennatum]|nr:gp58-like family protein [Rickettsia endosymbiont of Pseudomimeciton antennatum]
MFKRIIITFLGLSLLSGCTDGFRGYFKKSANNKIIDRKGFAGGKRPPLYNKKYIATAKRNVMEENFDDDEGDLLSEYDTETINPTLRNRQMYIKMVKQDAERSERRKQNQEKEYPSLNSANDKLKRQNNDENDKANSDLHKELEQIKAMLHETKKDLEKYKCPARQTTNQQTVDRVPSKPKTDSHKKIKRVETNKNHKTNKALGKSEMQKKFLSEEYDDIKATGTN